MARIRRTDIDVVDLFLVLIARIAIELAIVRRAQHNAVRKETQQDRFGQLREGVSRHSHVLRVADAQRDLIHRDLLNKANRDGPDSAEGAWRGKARVFAGRLATSALQERERQSRMTDTERNERIEGSRLQLRRLWSVNQPR